MMGIRILVGQTVLVNGKVAVVTTVIGEMVTVRFQSGGEKTVKASSIPSFQ